LKEPKIIDRTTVTVRGGAGGSGTVSFRREKFVPKGGPDGGDGGNGGHIFFRASDRVNSLIEFRYNQHIVAPNGEKGRGSNEHGANGENLIVEVPVGTVIKDKINGSIIADLNKKGKTACVARGGKGGRGNARFVNAKKQAPRICENGYPGEERRLLLEMKMIADVGLIGYPSVGKSTLISVISNAKPKIAKYHFTTLSPNLGVVKYKNGDSFLVADIPGLIDGAHNGAGLGYYFLRHIERTAILVHMIDISLSERPDPFEDYDNIRQELITYSDKLKEKEEIVVLSKADASIDEVIEETKRKFEEMDKIVFVISSITKSGINDLLDYLYKRVGKERLKRMETDSGVTELPEVEPVDFKIPERIRIEIDKKNQDVYEITGEQVSQLLQKINIHTRDGYDLIMRILKASKMNTLLKRKGVQEGDTVIIDDLEFDYLDDEH